MKNIQKEKSLLFILCFAFSTAFAQTYKLVDNKGTIKDVVGSPWLTKEGGNAIYNKNTGNVVIGNGTEPATVNANAALQFTQTDKGIMIPKVALVELFNPSPFAALGPSDDGLLVYNTATGGLAPWFFSPGFYYWSAINSWIPLIPRNGNVLFSLTGGFDGDISGLATQILIKQNAVNTGKIANGAVTNAKLQHSTITINGTPVALGESATITPSPVGTPLGEAKIWVGDGIAQELQMGGDVTMNSSGLTTIGNEKVTNAKIADDAVTTAKILNANVTNAKLANSTVKINGTTITLGQQDATISASPGGTTLGSAKMWVGDVNNAARAVDITGDVTINNTGLNTIGSSKVTAGKIAGEAVTEAKIAGGAVTEAKIGGGAVTEAKIATNAITTAKILDANVTNAKLANPTFTINGTTITLGQQDATITASPVGTALGESYIWVGDADNLAQAHLMSGDVTISNTGVTTIGASKVTYDKIQNVSATNSVLGRVSAGAGAIEEIPTTGSGNVVRANAPTFTGLVTTVASSGSSAGFRIPHGTAPSSPVDGDLWTTVGGLWLRQNGNTHRLAGLTVGTLDFTGTTLTFGSSTAASTIGIGTGATVSGSTKTVNIGTGATDGTTNVTIGSATGVSTTKINGSVQYTYTSTSSALTLTASHRYVVVRAGVAITLPAPAAVPGTIYTIIAKAAGVTISAFRNFLDTNTTTIGNGTSITIISNGVNWEQVN